MKFRSTATTPTATPSRDMQDYDVALEPTDRMLLDALVRIKAVDDTLAFRRSLPRGRLRLGRDEHQRQERARLHHQPGGPEGAGRDPPAARVAGDPRPDRRHVPVLQAVPLGQAVLDQRRRRRRRRSGCSRRRSARSSTGSTNAYCARAARPLARRSGGTPTSSSGRPGCCRPTGSSPIRATRRPTSASTTSRIRIGCSAAIRS